MRWPPCVSFVQAHPLHRELRREPGAPLAKPAPVQVGRRGLQWGSEDRHPLSALDSPLPPSRHTFLSLSSMPEFPLILPPPPLSLLLFGTYLLIYVFIQDPAPCTMAKAASYWRRSQSGHPDLWGGRQLGGPPHTDPCVLHKPPQPLSVRPWHRPLYPPPPLHWDKEAARNSPAQRGFYS